MANKYDYQTGVGISSWASAVDGSDVITTDAPSAAYDSSNGKVFVAVRSLLGKTYVAEGAAGTGGISSWTWHDLGFTNGNSPAVVVACGRVHVAVSAGGGAIYTIWRAAGGGKWSQWAWLVSTKGLPSLAVNSRDEVGLATTGLDTSVIFWKMPCDASTTPAFGPPVTVGDLGTSEVRVGLTAYGPYFAAAIRAKSGYPYFLLQIPGSGGSAVWPASFEPIDVASLTQWLSVAEAPVAVTFRGLIFLTARDASNALYYWIRNPNTLATRPDFAMWTGGRIVGGGLGKTPATLAPAGTRNLESRFANQPGAPAELFVAMRGLDDQIWALNMSRFATFDVLEGLYKMTVDTTTNFTKRGGVVGKGVPENTVFNIFENLETFLRTPSKYWDSLSDIKNGGYPSACASPGRTGITIYPNLSNDDEWVDGYCYAPRIAPGAVIDGIDGTAWKLWEEFGHQVLGMNRASNYGDSSWKAAFSKDVKPKTCSPSGTDCSPYNSCVSASTFGKESTIVKKFGASTNVCASRYYSGYRASGFTDDYALDSDEHNWIDTMLLYRWFGDELRAIAFTDAASHDPRLQTKYNYIRDKVFDGVEFNGSGASASANGDETRGGFAMPMR